LVAGKIQNHKTSKEEIESLRGVVGRDLADSSLPGLSADRCLATSYNAVLQLSRMVIACEGYRVPEKPGHHVTTLEAVRLALGGNLDDMVDYFDQCRRKRHNVDYDSAGITSDSEAKDLLEKANEFREIVDAWINDNHSQFSAKLLAHLPSLLAI